ncbi:MAG: ice-binding family protein, partial [Burkholderiales bacterium]|nr:ice-binding family protein [Burkholderiales bacterium]
TAVTDMQTAFTCATVTRPCDAGAAFNFPAATDFAALPQPLAAGHYCVTGAMSVGSPLTLTNPGVYIFQSTGALDTAVGPFAVTLAGGANAGNTFVYWVPGGITTIQANVAFLGSILSFNAGITLGANATLLGGRALTGAAVNLLSTNQIAIP